MQFKKFPAGIKIKLQLQASPGKKTNKTSLCLVERQSDESDERSKRRGRAITIISLGFSYFAPTLVTSSEMKSSFPNCLDITADLEKTINIKRYLKK